MGFSQALSGLSAATTNLDVIGNNVANSQTVGFKSSSTTFADVYANSRIGLGVRASGVVQNFTRGNLETTGRSLDLAISGDGFFKLQQGGQVIYSRNGQLTLTTEGYLENAQGGRLMTGNDIIKVPATAMTASATTRLESEYNLQASSLAPARAPFSAQDSGTYNYASTATVYDSLGNPHQLTTYFVKLDPAVNNKWQMYATLDGKELTAKQVDAEGNIIEPATEIVPTLTFSNNGTLLPTVPRRTDFADTQAGQAAYDAALVTYNTDVNNSYAATFSMPARSTEATGSTVAVQGLDNGADVLVFKMDLTGTTQFGNEFDQAKLTQDGYAGGSLVGVTIDKSGNIVGNYSNDQQQTVASVLLASFRNAEGLKPAGDNGWIETNESGQPLLGVPGVGRFGALQGGALEASNVDLTRQLVDLIVAQRTFQANAQAVKTQSEVLQETVNLR